MRIHTTHSRDAALRELHRINRWMIAGSVVLTGVLSDVAAHAFPGKTVKAGASSKKAHKAAKAHRPKSTHTSHTSTGVLRPPEQAPQSSTEATQSAESAPSRESAPAEEAAPAAEETAPSTEAAPAQEPTPAQESPPVQEAAPEPEAPVVSGGS